MARVASIFMAVTLLRLLDPEDEGVTIFRNVRKCLPNGTEFLYLPVINVEILSVSVI
jgi:hypothetical protein